MTTRDDANDFQLDATLQRLARKRQLARLLQEQSGKFQLVNPHARASWTNVAAPLTEAFAGKYIGDKADEEAKKYQTEQTEGMNQYIRELVDLYEGKQGAGEPTLAGLSAGPDQPPPPEPFSRQQNPLEQLIDTPGAKPSMGDMALLDQGKSTPDITSPLAFTPEAPQPATPPEPPEGPSFMAQQPKPPADAMTAALLKPSTQPSLGDMALLDQGKGADTDLPALLPKYGPRKEDVAMMPTFNSGRAAAGVIGGIAQPASFAAQPSPAAAPEPPPAPEPAPAAPAGDKYAPTDVELAAEQKYGLKPGTLAMRRRLERSPKGSVSTAGARGEHQIEPKNVAEYSRRAGRKLDPTNDADSAEMSAQVAADAQRKYPDDEAAQVAYYNGGWRAGDAVAAGKPTNAETTDYVKRWQEANLKLPAPGPTPAPTLAGPAVPGAVEPPPQAAAPPPQAAAPPPAQPAPAGAAPPPPFVPKPPGEAVAPAGAPPGMPQPGAKGSSLLAKPPSAIDIIKLAQKMPPGYRRDQVIEQAYKNLLTEPDRMYKIQQEAEDKRLRIEQLDRAAGLKYGAQQQGYGKAYDQLNPREQKVVDFYATLQWGGDATWRVGLSRVAGGSNLIKAVDERIPTMGEDFGLTAADMGTNKATRAAKSHALMQIEKDVTTIEPYAQMLVENGKIVKDLYSKMERTNNPFINKSLNWLSEHAASDPQAAEMLAQLRMHQAEATRVIDNPRLIGQMSVHSQQSMEAIYKGDMSFEAMTKVIDRLEDDAKRRVSHMREKRGELTTDIRKLTPGGAMASSEEQDAKAAIARGVPAERVRQLYKERTGKDLQ